mgnify:CR=1 FL=1
MDRIDCISTHEESTSTTWMASSSTSVAPIDTSHSIISTSTRKTPLDRTALMGSCLATGPQVIDFLDMGRKTEVTDFIGLVALFFLMRALAFVALYARAKFSR